MGAGGWQKPRGLSAGSLGPGSSLQLLDTIELCKLVLIKTEKVYSLGVSDPAPGNLTPRETIAYIHTSVCTRLFIVALCIEISKRCSLVRGRLNQLRNIT